MAEGLYERYRDDLVTGRRGAHQEYDRSVLSVAGAGLGLSIAFIKDIVPIAAASAVPILYLSWWLFAAAMVSVLVSFLTGQRAFDRQIRLADDYYSGRDPAAYDAPNRFAVATRILNLVSCVALVLAIVCTVSFASVNLSRTAKTAAAKHTVPAAK